MKNNLYLNLLKDSLLNLIYLDNEVRILYFMDKLKNGESFDYQDIHEIRNSNSKLYSQLFLSRVEGKFFNRKIENSGFNHSMIGKARLNNLHNCLDLVRRFKISGDFIECGVWRGGATIFMAGYLKFHNLKNKKIFIADSFEGLPSPSSVYDFDLDLSSKVYPQLSISIDEVIENFKKYNLFSENLIFIKGWFNKSLATKKIKKISLLRMDGDLYESTMDILDNLYDKVSHNGIIIVDDFSLEPCRKAVYDFFKKRNKPIPHFNVIDWTGVWFFKNGKKSLPGFIYSIFKNWIN